MKELGLVLLMLSVFVYGVGVGHYKIFPYNLINTIKSLLLKSTPKDFDQTPGYLHKISFFELNSRNKYDVVFIGDSMTDGSDWYDIYPELTIANRGISGDTTAGVLNRIDSITNTNAEKAFIMIGINDIGRGFNVDKIFKNYTKIINKLQENNMEVIIQSTLLTDGIIRDNDKVNKLNQRLIELSKESNDIDFIDLNPKLTINGKLNQIYSNDGLHLNGQGYKVWFETINKPIGKNATAQALTP